MKKLYLYSSHAVNFELYNQIENAAILLFHKFSKLDLTSLDISEYNKRYLGDKLRKGSLDIYCHILYLILNNNIKPYNRYTIVDYGGGCGILSLLAKEVGIGSVIYNDIYNLSCTDVKIISSHLGLPLNHIVCGDIDDLISYLKLNIIKVDAIASYDVIEHIYNLSYHFNKLASFDDSDHRIFYASSANSRNPRTVNRLKSMHIESEYINREKIWGHKERDSLRAYIEVRKEIIKQYAPEFNSKEIEKLSSLTRGLNQADIRRSVDEFREKGKISYCPDHPTNTCDPFTGNWKEHLIDFQWLNGILQKEGYHVEFRQAYYNMSGSKIKQILKLLINILIWLLGKNALVISPYFILCAERDLSLQNKIKSSNVHNDIIN